VAPKAVAANSRQPAKAGVKRPIAPPKAAARPSAKTTKMAEKVTKTTSTVKKPALATKAKVAEKQAAKPAPAKAAAPKQAAPKPAAPKPVAKAPVAKAAPAPKPVAKKAEAPKPVAKAAPAKPEAKPAPKAAAKPVEAPKAVEAAKPAIAKAPAKKVEAVKPVEAKPAPAPAAAAIVLPPRPATPAGPAQIIRPNLRAKLPAPPEMPIAKVRAEYKVNDKVVYPTHGVGQIMKIEELAIGDQKIEMFVIEFDRDKMIVRVPLTKLAANGVRKLASPNQMKTALDTLKGKARIKRTMWSRRAQEYEAKINSGDPVAIAEVVRDLHRNAGQPDQSYSERQIYEKALDRLAHELAAVEKIDDESAAKRLEKVLKAA
jgi:CarD family transcriptional regulator